MVGVGWDWTSGIDTMGKFMRFMTSVFYDQLRAIGDHQRRDPGRSTPREAMPLALTVGDGKAWTAVIYY